jgi:galactokinase
MVHHELGASAYNERRASCEAAVEALRARLPGIQALRDVSSDQLSSNADVLEPVTLRRARHVVSEDERVLGAMEALEHEDLARFGGLMNESHESLRDDYEVSCEELDLMVGIARRSEGCLGARLTGAGFGGCTVNLVKAGAVELFAANVARGYEARTGLQPEIYVCSPAEGARIDR